MFMRFIAPAALLLATSLADAQQSTAQAIDAAVEPPIIIDSDSARSDLRSGITRFNGNVTIQRGAMEVKADEGVVHQTNGRYTLLELFGSPTTWHDRLDDGSIVDGQADRIQYDVIENVITLTGNAQLRHERGEWFGEELIYDLDTENLDGRGSDGNQARVVLEGDAVRRRSSQEDDGNGEAAPQSDDEDSQEPPVDPPADR